MLQNLPIKIKITVLLMTTSAMAVVLVCLMFYFSVSQSFQKTYASNLNDLVEIVGNNCMAALLFNVPEDAATVLSTLEKRKSILAVRLYDKKHNLFAAYTKNTSLTDNFPADPNSLLATHRYQKFEHQIALHDGSTIGRIIVYDDIRGLGLSNKKWMLILTALGLVALVAAFILATFMQNVISQPLLLLTKAVQRLAAGDFEAGHGIQIQRQDEIGSLAAAFIEMNRKLQDSHSSLEIANQNLENRVTARTEELQKALFDLTKTHEQLVLSEKMVAVGHLVAGVAHEINNSLNFISGAIPAVSMLMKKIDAQLLEESGHTPFDYSNMQHIFEKIHLLLKNAETGVHRTAKIVADLNTFARPSRGQFTPTDIQQEIEMVITLLHYELRNRVEVLVDFPPAFPLVSCLRDQMNQVYMNILRNAIQSIPDQGTIWITAQLDGDMVRISFRDNGCGIPNSVKNQIFTPFFSTKEVGEGAGLGLSISYGIMKNHGGEILIDSTIGQGTTFTLLLPLHAEKLPPAGSAITPSLPMAQGLSANRVTS